MTRDTKLALVVGFALVLAVGVLISDHFASGYQSPPADLVETQPAVHVREIVGDGQDYERPTTPERRQRPNRRQNREEQAQDPGPSRELANRNQGEQAVPPPQEFLLGSPEFHEFARSGPARELLPHERGLNGGPFTILPLVDTREKDRVSPLDLRADRNEPDNPDPAPAAKPVFHIVADGESLWEIAKYYYGKGSVWQKLAKVNADRVGKNGVVRTGVRLRIPEAIAMGLPPRGLPKPPATSESKQPNKPANQPTNETSKTYVVAKNETLSEIASKQLGTTKRMGELMKLNSIEDPDAIRAGMVLRLPT